MRKLSLMNLAVVLSSVYAVSVVPAAAQTVNWAAQGFSGFGSSSGIDLPIGDAVRIGFFANNPGSADYSQMTDAAIQAIADSYATLNSHFVSYGSASIGDGGTGAGQFTAQTIASTANIESKQIYYWVFDNATAASATEHGIFYRNKDVIGAGNWAFPANSAENSTSVDIDDLTNTDGFISPTALGSGATLVVGSWGTGTLDSTGAPLFNLAAVPEPSTYAVIFGVLCLAGALVKRKFCKLRTA